MHKGISTAVMGLAALLILAACGSTRRQVVYMPVTCTASPPFKQHPAAFAFSCDGNRVVKNIRWSSWGGDRATGRATMLVEGPCDPACSVAASYSYPVRLVATDIATCPNSQRVYGLVTAYLPATNAAGLRSNSLRLESCE